MLEKNYLVTKANELIMFRGDLSAAEQRLICEVAAQVQPDDTEFDHYNVPIAKYLELAGSNAKNEHTRLKKIAKGLISKPIEITKPTGWVIVGWFSSVEYIEGEGVLQCKFSEHLKPFLWMLKEKFTTYQIENMLRLRSKYAMRLYEICKCVVKLKVWEIELDELRKKLTIPVNYTYQHIKMRVLNPSRKALKATDIRFDYESIKRGRRVHAIRFFITEDPQKKLNLGPPESVSDNDTAQSQGQDQDDGQILTRLLDLVPAEKRKSVKKLIQEKLDAGVKPSYIAPKIAYCNEQKTQKNYGGLLRKAIENDYQATGSTTKTTTKKNKAIKSPPSEEDIAAEQRALQKKLFFQLPEKEQQKYIDRAAAVNPEIDISFAIKQIAAENWVDEQMQNVEE